MVSLGTFSTVLTAIDLLREVLEKSGIDRSKAAQIAGEFLSKLRSRGGTPVDRGGKEQQQDFSVAFVPESWEYATVSLTRVKVRRGTKRLAPGLRDGVEIAGDEPPELAAYLNQLAGDGWEVMMALDADEAPTLLLRREKRPEGS